MRAPAVTLITLSVATVLIGCGGGGGPSATTGNLVRPDVPFHTPVRIDTVKPIDATRRVNDSSAMFAANISSATGPQDIIMAGRMSPDGGEYRNFNMQIWSWSGGSLVNRTTQWFSGTDNQIVGTEPSVKFSDFDGDGRQDIWISPHTDNNVYGPGVVFFNNGTNFSRVNIELGNINAHDSAIYDINRDGLPDIFATGSRVSFAHANRTFTTHVVTGRDPFGGDYGGTAGAVAVADFMGDGTSSIILTDQNQQSASNNRLYSWQMVNGGRATLDFQLTHIANLPTPRFLLPKWSGHGFTGSHDVRVLAFDFDSSGRASAVVFSRPWRDANGQWPLYSEVQFNKNMGGGVFVDVTDQVLIGYDTSKPAPYNPTLMDVNSDGLIDIVLSNAATWTDNSGASVLIHTREHKYVASYATVLRAFADQAMDIERALGSSTSYGDNGIVFVQGPDGKMYLATSVNFTEGGVQKKAIYLSQLGTMSATAQATADSIRQRWPWMSTAQVNAVLAQSSTVWFGLHVLDSDRAMAPIGELRVPSANGMLSISGAVGGLQLKGAADRIKVMDQMGRDYDVNYGVTSFTPFNAWNRSAEHMHSGARSLQFSYANTQQWGNIVYSPNNDMRNAVIGITRLPLGRYWDIGAHYSTLPFNPFVMLSGSWGTVIQSGTFETVATYRQQGWMAKTGMMWTTTELTPGLVRRVNPITSVWTEIGYDQGPLRAYVGIMPVVVSGSADITLPTGVDTQGRITYTDHRVAVLNNQTQYARLSWTGGRPERTSYSLSGMISSQNHHNIMASLRHRF